MNYELQLPVMLLLVLAPIGLFDVAYYHIYKFRLAEHPDSWTETKTHIARGVLMGAFMIVLSSFRPDGVWFWLIGSLLALDTVNSLLDAFTEEESRKRLGGLPNLEYMIHIGGSMGMGAVTLAYFLLGWKFQSAPTALVPLKAGVLPSFVSWNALLGGIASILIALYEGMLMWKSKKKAKQVTTS